VRVRSVAIGTTRECHSLLEVPAGVALRTLNQEVFSEQRISRIGMIEPLTGRNLFPTCGGVAGFAGLWKGAVMRIGVAVAAFCEWDSGEAWLAALRGCRMTFLTSHLCVQSRERKVRLVVIEFCGCFPIYKIVALRAVLPELAAVRVLMAGHAIGGQTKKRLVQVFDLDQRANSSADVRRCVALVAGNVGVFTLQRVSGLVVVETPFRRNPVDQLKILAVVLRVTFRAVFPVGELRVQTAPSGNLSSNFCVAPLTIQYRRALTHDVAARALRGTAERLMSLGKRPRRNLGAERRDADEREEQRQAERDMCGL